MGIFLLIDYGDNKKRFSCGKIYASGYSLKRFCNEI